MNEYKIGVKIKHINILIRIIIKMQIFNKWKQIHNTILAFGPNINLK